MKAPLDPGDCIDFTEGDPPLHEEWSSGTAWPVATLTPEHPVASLSVGPAWVLTVEDKSSGSSAPMLPKQGCGNTDGTRPRGQFVPGRNPDSLLPWEFFLGHAAHRLISYMYGIDHPNDRVYYNKDSIFRILDETKLGDVSRLLPGEGLLRPDITNTSTQDVFEIKPRNEDALQEGRAQVRTYLDALNRAVQSGFRFTGGTGFTGATHILFGDGCHVWRLEWENPEPGMLLYQWTRTRQCFRTAAEAYESGDWVELTVEEMAAYGGWVAHMVEGMVWRRETLAAFRAGVGIVVKVVGLGSVAIFSGAVLGRPAPRPSAGKVLPFHQRTSPPSPRDLPKASGM